MFTSPQRIPKEAVHLRSAPPLAIWAALGCELRVEQGKNADAFTLPTTRERVRALCTDKHHACSTNRQPGRSSQSEGRFSFSSSSRPTVFLTSGSRDDPHTWVERRLAGHLHCAGAQLNHPSILRPSRQLNCSCLHLAARHPLNCLLDRECETGVSGCTRPSWAPRTGQSARVDPTWPVPTKSDTQSDQSFRSVDLLKSCPVGTKIKFCLADSSLPQNEPQFTCAPSIKACHRHTDNNAAILQQNCRAKRAMCP